MLGAIRKLRELILLIGKNPDAAESVARLKKTAKIAFALLVATELLEIAAIYPLKYFFDGISQGRGLGYLLTVIGVMACVDIVVRVVSTLMQMNRHRVDWQDYTMLFGFGHTKQLNMDVRWHIVNGTNEKESMIGKNVQRIDNLMSAMIYEGLPLVVRIALTIGVLIFISPLFAGLATCVVAGYALTMGYNYRRHINALDKDFHADWKDMHNRGTELSTRARMLKQFGVENVFASKFREKLEFYLAKDLPRNNKWRGYQRRAEYVLVLGFPAMYILLAFNYGKQANVGMVVLLSAWLQRIFINLYQFREVQRRISEGAAALDDYIDLFKEMPQITQPATKLEPEKLMGGIELKDVCFSYNDGYAHTLKNLNLCIEAGETVALVGPSGSGKTTLASLLCREFDPTSGALYCDGVDLRNYDYDFYRNVVVGMVSQDVQLLDGTIEYNISLGNECLSEEDITMAAKLAHADEFINKLENGYATLVGENGVRLSGGQKQRIAIARTLLREPYVLIMDEATSALDAESQAMIQETIDERIRNRNSTIIIIAHRLSTVRSADKVCYMEDGQIVEVGSHRELIKLNGLYAEMVRREMGAHLD